MHSPYMLVNLNKFAQVTELQVHTSQCLHRSPNSKFTHLNIHFQIGHALHIIIQQTFGKSKQGLHLIKTLYHLLAQETEKLLHG